MKVVRTGLLKESSFEIYSLESPLSKLNLFMHFDF